MMNRKLFVGALFWLALFSTALAASIDFMQPMIDLTGQPIPTSQTDKTPVTLGDVAATALLNSYPDERDITGDEKVKRFDLAVLAKGGKPVDLTAENVAKIKQLIAKSYGPLIVGRAYAILDPDTKAAQK
jgi:hypothetical protein